MAVYKHRHQPLSTLARVCFDVVSNFPLNAWSTCSCNSSVYSVLKTQKQSMIHMRYCSVINHHLWKAFTFKKLAAGFLHHVLLQSHHSQAWPLCLYMTRNHCFMTTQSTNSEDNQQFIRLQRHRTLHKCISRISSELYIYISMPQIHICMTLPAKNARSNNSICICGMFMCYP